MRVNSYMEKHIKTKLTILTIFTLLSIVTLSCQIFSSQTKSTSGKTEEECVKLPVLMYHMILEKPTNKNKFIISCNTFEEDMKYIKKQGYTTILVKDLIDYTQGKANLPPKPILLTFDDGAYNNYLYAFPIAQKYGAKFVFSPIGKETQKYSDITDENPLYAHANRNHTAQMHQSGAVEIQNHTYNMHCAKNGRIGCTKTRGESQDKYKEKLIADITKAQETIKEITNSEPTAFFYPFGACSECTEEIIKSLGFKATFLCESKINRITRNPESLFGLKRFLRPPGVSSEKFFSSFEKLQ